MDLDDVRDHILRLQERAVGLMAVEAELERQRAHTRRGTREYAAIQEQILNTARMLSVVVAAITEAHAARRQLLRDRGLAPE